TIPCANRQEVMMSPDEKISYCKSCMPNVGYKKKMIRLIETEMQGWYEENQLQYERVPPHNPECEVIFKGKAPLILSPTANGEYYISKKNPEPLQLACQTGNDVDRVYWYVDDQFYRSASPGEKLFFVPREGPVKISCTDDKGRNNNIRITVKFSSL
ncbi:MAG: penicillin-binding protein 1C, partial [Chitinophagaceae bacterium]|nr:penicillin-binding protein 1C [Chitinophagaceae bacterium]